MSTCGTFVVFICGVAYHNYYDDKSDVYVCPYSTLKLEWFWLKLFY